MLCYSKYIPEISEQSGLTSWHYLCFADIKTDQRMNHNYSIFPSEGGGDTVFSGDYELQGIYSNFDKCELLPGPTTAWREEGKGRWAGADFKTLLASFLCTLKLFCTAAEFLLPLITLCCTRFLSPFSFPPQVHQLLKGRKYKECVYNEAATIYFPGSFDIVWLEVLFFLPPEQSLLVWWKISD